MCYIRQALNPGKRKHMFFKRNSIFIRLVLSVLMLLLAGCGGVGRGVYRDQNMDFGAVKTVAVLPFENLSGNMSSADRVRDVFMTMLLSTGGVYVVPNGEVVRGISRSGMVNPTAPSAEEVKKFAGIVHANAVVTGVIREYGEIRSGTSSSNVISLSLQMIEPESGRIIWSAESTKGGVTLKDRLLGGGGEPMDRVTEAAVDELINKLFR